jgi:hemerythrin-like domain-containing protein
VGVMLMDHDRARALIHEMTQAAGAYKADEETAGKQWARAASHYSALMKEHFDKEEEVIFRMADEVFSPEEQDAMATSFERLEKEKIGPGKHEELGAMMKELIAQNRNR